LGGQVWASVRQGDSIVMMRDDTWLQDERAVAQIPERVRRVFAEGGNKKQLIQVSRSTPA
jgi:hypothetical protein